VLLADDNEDFATSFSLILEKLGHEVAVAHDGLQAGTLAASFGPHVAFLDIGLPGLNGYDLARRIRSAPGGDAIVLVAVTGWGQEHDKRTALEAGFDHHLVKPVEMTAVIRLLAVAKPRAPRAQGEVSKA
jgi:CheY-like chemotaxis protein